jgi:hypothetical protein
MSPLSCAQEKRLGVLETMPLVQKTSDGSHRVQQAFLVFVAKSAQQFGDFVARTTIQRLEYLFASIGKMQQPRPAVAFGTDFLDQTFRFEFCKNAAQITLVQAQFGGKAIAVVGEFVKDARLRK